MPTLHFKPYLVDAPLSPASSYADNGMELDLAGITDFSLRQKTARSTSNDSIMILQVPTQQRPKESGWK